MSKIENNEPVVNNDQNETGSQSSKSTASKESGSPETGGANYVPKDKYDKANGKLKDLESKYKEASNKLSEIEAQEAERYQKSLLEDKKYEELIEEKDNALNTLKQEFEEERNNFSKSIFESQLAAEATKQNARDISDIRLSVSMGDFEKDESGRFVGIDQKIMELKDKKPYLFENPVTPNPELNKKPGSAVSNDAKQNTTRNGRRRIGDLLNK